MLILGILFAQIWPTIQNGIDALAHGIVNLGAIGSGLFGLLNRLLIPIGLHHVMNTYFWFVFGDFTNAEVMLLMVILLVSLQVTKQQVCL